MTLLFVFILLLFLMAIFTSGEIAILTIGRYKLEQEAEKGNRAAKRILYFLDRPAQFFSLVQIGNNGLSVALGALTTVIALKISPEAVLLGNIFVTLLIVLLGEIVPKSFAAKKPKLSYYLVPFFHLLYLLFFPAIVLLSLASRTLMKLVGGEEGQEAKLVTEEEIKYMLKYAEKAGEVDAQEKQMIQRVFEFSDTVVREVMVPRIDMVCLKHTSSVKEAIDTILRYGHSRIPVYREKVDKIQGILYAKDLLQYWENPPRSLAEICRPAFFVPETKKVTDLFAEMRRQKVHMAIVLDEYGGVAGLVTIEDLLEEIVGEIQDEYDREEPFVQVVSPNVTLMDARLNLDEASRYLGKELKMDGIDTVGGLVFHLLGRVPEEGETVTYNGYEFVAEAVRENRIQKVKVIKKKSD